MCVMNKYNFILFCLKVKTFFHAINFKKITTTTLHVLLFALVFISSWATPQEEAYANTTWECNDAAERAYFYKLDWEFTDNFFTISQYVATSTSTVNLDETQVSLSGLTVDGTSITGVKGINGLAMSPDGKMYVTITSSANGTDLFQINTDGSLTHLKNMGSYGTIGQLDFYQLPGGGGHYGFSSGEYVSKDGIDRIYFSQGAFDTDSDGNGSDIARPNSNMIYNVSNGTTTTFPDPEFVSPINAADFAYVGDWDGYELVTYDAINNKIHRFDIDNPSNSSSIDPQTGAFSGASTVLSAFSYKTPQGEIRFIVDDTNGMRFEIVRNGTNNYSVTQKGSSFLTNNSDGASCGPNAFDPFSPTFKATLTACSDGFATPQLKITNNKSSTQYFDVDVSVDGGSFTNLVDGQSVAPGNDVTLSANPEYDGRTIQFRMRYNSSNPSNSATSYNVGSLLTVSGCGNYTLATGSVATANGTCLGDGTSKPTITLTATGNTTVFFDVEYKVGNSAWQALKDGEQVAVGSPETYEITSAEAHNSSITFRYIVGASNPSSTDWTESSSVSVNCPVYSMTVSLNSPSCATNEPYKTYQLTVQNTGNQAAYFHSYANYNVSGSYSMLVYGDHVQPNSTRTYSAIFWHGVTPEIRWIYSTSSNTHNLFTSGVNGSYTSNSSYGSSVKSGDSYLTITDSEVDCFYVGKGGFTNNSSSNYISTTKTISQVCDAQGSATARFTIKQRDSDLDSYNGFIDVDYSTNGSSWSTLADGVAFNDGVTLTYDSPSTLSSGSTAYFRFRIDETDPDSTAAWGIYTQDINCQADFNISQAISTCTSSGQTSTLTITNNESQTIYYRAVPSKVGANHTEETPSNYEDDDIQLFSVPANTTYTHTTTKNYPYGISSHMYWKVQGSFSDNPDWTNESLHNINYITNVETDCNPSTLGTYAMSSCSLTGKTSTLTITNNESSTIYVRVQPSEDKMTSASSYTNASYYDASPTPLVYAIPANTTVTYDASARPGFQQTYSSDYQQNYYAHWRYQVSYVENVSWQADAFPYVYVSQYRTTNDITSGSYQISCNYYETKPTTDNFYQYQFEDNTRANACINDEIWVTNQFYANGYNSNDDYNKMWWIFEYSVDDGQNYSTANIFYRKHGSSNNLSINSGFESPSSQPTNDGWTETTTTGTYIETYGYYSQYFTIGTRVADGSVVKLRYKKAFTQAELANVEYVELGSQNKSTTQRTAECDLDLTDFIEGSGGTDVTINGTVISNLLTQDTCQNDSTGGFADTTFSIKSDSGSATFYMRLEKKVDGANDWTTVYTNFELISNSLLTETVQLNHGQTIQYKLHISPDTGDFSNATAYTTPVLTVNCPSTGAQLVFALGDCVSGGNRPLVTITNTGYQTAYYDVNYSVDGTNWLPAFGEGVYKQVLPEETEQFVFTTTITQGSTVLLQYRHAPTGPVTSGAFTTVNNTILVDCDVNATIGDVLQVYTDASCYGGNQRFKVKVDNNEATSIQLQYRASEDGGSSWPHTGSVTVNASTDDYVTIPVDFQHGDSVTFEFRTELTATSAYSTYTSKGPYTVSCNLDDYFTLSTYYDGCSAIGPDILALRATIDQSTGQSYNYLHFDIDISYDGEDWNPFGPWVHYGYTGNEDYTTNRNSNGYYSSAYPSHSGWINIGTQTSIGYFHTAYHFTDSSHAYKIRYRYYNSNNQSHDHAALMNLSWTEIDVPANINCEKNDLEPVTLVSTQQQCQENRGKVQFTFTDTTISHNDPYDRATLFYRYSTNGGNTYSSHTKIDLNNSTEFLLPESVTLPNTTAIQIQWGYIRNFHKLYNDFDHIGSTTKNGLYTRMPTSTESYSDSTLSTNFRTFVYANTTTISVDCDPASTYTQVITECECSDAGANSTLNIKNDENYTTYYKVMYSLDGGDTWQYSNPNIESAYDISVAAGATDSSQTVFVPDGQTITWRIKDTTNGGDFVGQEWEIVDTSETVDCGCSGGVVDLDLGSCSNGSSTPTITLDVNSTDTTYFRIEYKRSNDNDWVLFRAQETVTGGSDAQLQLNVTVLHTQTIQVRYRISKNQSALATADLKYTDTLTVDCPFNTVSFTPSAPVCTTNNVQQPKLTVVNTTSSTSSAYVNVQYKITNTSSEALAAGNWIDTSLMGNELPANGVPYVTADTINVSEGQKIVWRYEWSYTDTFFGNWTYNNDADFVNCVKDFTITEALGSCNAGEAASTLTISNNESINKLYFQVEKSTDNQNWVTVDGNVEVDPSGYQNVSVSVEHNQKVYWRITASNVSNSYSAVFGTEAPIEVSEVVDCPVIGGTASYTMGNCSNNAQQSTLKMENPISSNSNTFFHVEWSLDGGNSWETPHVAEVQPGGEAFKTVSVPNGQTIRWRYHPHTQVATPTGVTYTPLTESPIADCTYDTIENVGLGDCDTSGEAVSSYVLTNNTSITLVYKVQYKIQGQSGFTTVDDAYELTAGQVSPTPFTQSVPSGKYIEWRYAVGTNASLAATATAETPVQTQQVNCDIVDPGFDIAQGTCRDGSKDAYFYAKNGAAATTPVYFQVWASVNDADYVEVSSIIVSPNDQAPVQYPTSLSDQDTIKWRYKTSKDNVNFSTEFSFSEKMTISCIGNSAVEYTIPTACNSDGTKTATITAANSSSEDKYYLIEYATNQNADNWATYDIFGLAPSDNLVKTEYLTEGEYFTLRYKIASTGTTAAFDAIGEYTMSQTSSPANCSGDISVRVTLDACDGGARKSLFYFRNKQSTGAPVFFEIEYSIDGGAWVNPLGNQIQNYYTAQHTIPTELSVDVLVPSGSKIQWRYKDTLTVEALATKSFTDATTSAQDVICEGLLEHTVSIGACIDRKASSTLKLENVGFVDVYADIWVSFNGGSSYVEHAQGQLISNSSESTFTRNNIPNGSVVRWKYKYSSTPAGVSTALDNETLDKTAINCDEIIVTQLTYDHNFGECVQGQRIGTFTITNPSSTNTTVYAEVRYRTKSSATDNWSEYISLPIGTIAAGSSEPFSAPAIPSGGSIDWSFRASLASNDFAGNWTNDNHPGYNVECIASSSATQTYSACTEGQQYSILTIKNTGSVTQYYRVSIKINDGTTDVKWQQKAISAGDEFAFEWPISQGDTINWEYVPSLDTDFSDDSTTPLLLQTNQCTPTFSLATQKVCADSSSVNNIQVTNTKVTLTLKNTSSVDGSVRVQYRYLQTDSWSTLGDRSLNANQETTMEYTLTNPSVEFRYAPVGTENWNTSSTVFKINDCETVSDLTAVNQFICSEDQPFSTIKITNPGSSGVTATYAYSFNGTNWINEKTVFIGAQQTYPGEPVNVTKGTSIIWKYKTSSNDNFKTLTDTAPVNCDTAGDLLINQTLGTCENNEATSEVTVTNLSNTSKSYLLEYKIDNGPFLRYETLVIAPNSSISKPLQVSDGQTIQWRAIDATTDPSLIAVDNNWTPSISLNLNCSTTPTTTTTVPENKFIFEPLISTNRVCSEDGGAMFGITVDNTRSNVDADVIQRVWVDKFTVFEKQETIPAGESIQFSSFEISEDKFFTVEFEVTNVKNDKTQSMVKNKTSDCLDNGISPTDEQNPVDGIEVENIIDGTGDDEEMGDNGDDIFFLPGDDFVEWVYNEDALDISPPPLCPGDASCNNVDPPFADTGSNVGRLIILLGSLLMMAGGFILSRGYRF